MTCSLSRSGAAHQIQTPMDERTIASVEAMLGLRLPLMLRAMHRDVGKGGFGPGYGLLPPHLHDDSTEQETETATELYSALRKTDPEDQAWVCPPAIRYRSATGAVPSGPV